MVDLKCVKIQIYQGICKCDKVCMCWEWIDVLKCVSKRQRSNEFSFWFDFKLFIMFLLFHVSAISGFPSQTIQIPLGFLYSWSISFFFGVKFNFAIPWQSSLLNIGNPFLIILLLNLCRKIKSLSNWVLKWQLMHNRWGLCNIQFRYKCTIQQFYIDKRWRQKNTVLLNFSSFFLLSFQHSLHSNRLYYLFNLAAYFDFSLFTLFLLNQ